MQNSIAQPRAGADRKLLIAAASLGLLAALLAVIYLSSAKSTDKTAAAPIAQQAVVVAAKDIGPGQKISADMLTVKQVALTDIVPGSFTVADQVVGQTLRYPVSAGEQVLAREFVAAQSGKALSFQIPPGLRGMAIPVSSTNTPAQLFVPGDFVDVIAIGDNGVLGATAGNRPASGATAAVTILQNVQVLSVGNAFVNNGVPYDPSVRGDQTGGGVSYVTIAVTPAQTQLVALAQDQGRLLLVLRPFGEDSTTQLPPKIEPLLP